MRRWTYDGTIDRIHHVLYVKCREQADRNASPIAGIIDSQSVKGAENCGARIDPAGYDAGKKIKGKKRHLLVDTQGLLMCALFGLYPFLLKLHAEALCRQRLPGTEVQGWPEARMSADQPRDRQAVRCWQVRCVTRTLDCREHHRLA
jgi:hypothetical protein